MFRTRIDPFRRNDTPCRGAGIFTALSSALIALISLSGQALAQSATPAEPFSEIEPEEIVTNSRIVGGVPARPGQWLSMVALFRRDFAGGQRSFCGGTIIARRFVLTAAHCVDDMPEAPSLLFIREGATNLSVEGRTIDVRTIRVHPQYRSSRTRKAPLNDVALLELVEDAKSPAQPLLAQRSESKVVRAGRLSTVIGFGLTAEKRSITGFSGGGSDYLLQVDLPIVANTRCLRRYGSDNITAATICAGFEQGQRDSCQGDSGGPLFIPLRQGPIVQVGVVSWGPGCARPNAFGVYASVAHFESWIRSHVPEAGFADDLPETPAAPAVVASAPAPAPPPPAAATTPAPRPPAPAATPAAQPKPPAAAAPPSPPPAPATTSQAAETAMTDVELAQLLGQTENLAPSAIAQVSISISAGERVPVGHAIRIRVTSSVSGKLVLFNQNAEGKAYQIFPNRFTRPGIAGVDVTTIESGRSVLVPGDQDGFQFRLAPPHGRNRLIAVVMPPETELAQVVQPARDMRSLPSLARHLEQIRKSGTGAASPATRAVGILAYEIVP